MIGILCPTMNVNHAPVISLLGKDTSPNGKIVVLVPLVRKFGLLNSAHEAKTGIFDGLVDRGHFTNIDSDFAVGAADHLGISRRGERVTGGAQEPHILGACVRDELTSLVAHGEFGDVFERALDAIGNFPLRQAGLFIVTTHEKRKIVFEHNFTF